MVPCGGREVVCRVGTLALEIPAHLVLELPELGGIHIQLPLQIAAHLPLHLVDLPQREHLLSYNQP